MFIEEIANIVSDVYKELGYPLDKATISLSNRPELCDYQCNDVFKIAKLVGLNPLEVGSSVVNKINSCNMDNLYFNKVEFIKPGFINLTLSNEFISKYIKLFESNIKSSIDLKDSEKIVIDYGGPNVAKPLHVGHMRTAIVGESIKRILRYFNNEVISDVHLGDIGLQIGQVIYKVLEDNLSIDDINIDYLNNAYPFMSSLCKVDEVVKEKCAQITKELQDGYLEYVDIWKKIVDISIKDIKRNYDYLNVDFEYWYGESDAYKYLEETESLCSNLLKSSQGAMIIDVKSDEDKLEIPPLLFKKSNGAYLYASTDLATIYQRKKEFNPDKILYVTDLRQGLHFKQVFRVSEKADLFPIDNLEHLGYGTVNGIDNKPFKTRSGDTPKLSDLFMDAKKTFISKKEDNKNLSNEDLDIIVNSILKFADLQNSRDKDYIFDLTKFSEVNGKTGPYILYTYLRIKKVLDNYDYSETLSNNIYNEYDRNLRLKLLEIGKSLTLAYEERKPNYIAEYLYNLCSVANMFYQNNYLTNITDDTQLKDYTYILNLTNKYIKELCDLLVISIPSQM